MGGKDKAGDADGEVSRGWPDIVLKINGLSD
jgi:hypothetical protein